MFDKVDRAFFARRAREARENAMAAKRPVEAQRYQQIAKEYEAKLAQMEREPEREVEILISTQTH